MKKLILAVAASILIAPAVHAQCAGHPADCSAAEKAEQKAKEAKEAAEKQQLRDALGNGMAGQAADATSADHSRTEKQTNEALKDDQPPPK